MVVGNQGLNHPSLFVDQPDDERVPVIGLGLELAAKGGLGIGGEDGGVPTAVVVDDDGPVVGDELCKQAADEKRQENPQRPKAAPVGPEVGQTARRQGADLHAEEALAFHGSALLGFEGDARIDDVIGQITDQAHDQTQ
jgi:hypothetical protein